MTPSAAKGNDPELWTKLLEDLDAKLQLGLLDHLRRIRSYHFEDQVLTIEPADPSDYQYLSKGTVFQQLQLLAQDATCVEKVKLEKPGLQ